MTQTCPQCQAVCAGPARFCGRCGAQIATGTFIRSATRVTPLLERWRGLSRAMTRKDIRRLLGEPLALAAPDARDRHAEEVWTYEYEAVGRPAERARGLVRFCPTDGRVLSWEEPEWGRLDNATDEEASS